MIYKFPIYYRFTAIGKVIGEGFGAHTEFLPYRKYIHVDEVGLSVSYAREEDLTPDNVRRHLTARTSGQYCCMAPGPHGALEKFFSLPGARIGGNKSRESKAIWIEGVIIEYPDCVFMHEGEYDGDASLICGEFSPNPCFLADSWDALDGCPVVKYQDAIKENEIRMEEMNIEMENKREPSGRYEILIGRHIPRCSKFKIETIDGYKFMRVDTKKAGRFKDFKPVALEKEVVPDAVQLSFLQEETA